MFFFSLTGLSSFLFLSYLFSIFLSFCMVILTTRLLFWTTFPGQRQNAVLQLFSDIWPFPPASFFSLHLAREKEFFRAFLLQVYTYFF